MAKCVDLDFPVLEYSGFEPRINGLIEYKCTKSNSPTNIFENRRHRALSNFATAAGEPFFICYYKRASWWYLVVPFNNIAKSKLAKQTCFTERKYIEFLYGLGQNKVPKEVLDKACSVLPKDIELYNLAYKNNLLDILKDFPA